MMLLNHPGLIEHHAEEVAALDFGNADLARLREAMLALTADRDPQDLPREALERAGLGPLLARIDARIEFSPWYLKPEAAEADVDVSLRQALALHRKARALHRELKTVEIALGGGATEQDLARLREIQAELAALEGREAALDGYGAMSGRQNQAL